MNTLSFRGITKDYLIVTKGLKRPAFSPVKRNVLTIPNRPGAFLQSTDTDIRVLEVPILIKAENYLDLQKVKEDLAEWLITDQAEELILPGEEDRLYYAIVDGAIDLSEIVEVGEGKINFICLDPYKYGSEKSTEFVDAKTFFVEGTVETDPIIKVTVDSDTTFLAVSNGDDINMIGSPIEVTQQPFVREEQKLWHQMNTLVGWADTTSVEEGTITGTMKTDSYSFYSDSYGSASGWHGPAKKISIGSSIQDFQVDALIRQLGVTGQSGSIEIALLDASNNFVAKMLMTKRSINSPANWARLRAGSASNGYDILNTRGANDYTWANFNGMLRIARVGNVWTTYVCLIDENGVQHTRDGIDWPDTLGVSTAPITQIQVQLWQYGTTPTTNQRIDDIKVYKINSAADNQIPYVARAGDVIEFNHVEDKIFRNGEPLLKEKAFIGEYFPLKKGMNTVVLEPADAIQSTEVRWRPKWL